MPPEIPVQFDHYTLETNEAGSLTVLSSDGTGSTHRARDSRTGQHVIVRIFSERLLADSSVQKEFVEHAKLLIELDHPSITRIVDTGQHADQFFYVLEDPRGQTVEEWVNASGPLDVAHTLRLHLQLSEALLAVRTKPGLLSRAWPRSLMITGQGQNTQIHLLAQNLVAPSEEEEQPEFLAPEILAGHQDTAQASLYSIGATLYYMLTGQSPYPSGLPKEDLLELKSKRLPDMAVLPEASPVTLLRQVLDAEPRNRPKSLMEWDRALQRFIRFTPADTSPITVKTKPAEDADLKAEPMAKPAFTPFHTTKLKRDPEPEAETKDPELDKAKIHTQRLSVELTKRVQKELALTEKLQTLESELQEERTRVQELTSKQVLPDRDELTRLRAERSKIDGEWNKLQDARKNLEKEQHEFLKKTQRFSVGSLNSPTAPSEKSELTETQRVTSKPRFFRLGRKAKAEKTDKPKAVETPPKAKTKDTPKPAPSKATKPQAKPEPKDSKVVTFKNPKAAKPPEVPAKLAATAQEKTTAKPQKAVQKTSKPTSRLAADTNTPVPVAEPSAPNKEASRKAQLPTPQYKPLPGAWLALGILAAVIALGLFLAYRTFFSRHDNYLLGTINPAEETTVVDLNPADEPAPFEPLVVPETTFLQTETPEPETISVEATTTPTTQSKPRPTREASVNEELRVDMKAFNNFLLIQDEEWKEVLHGLKNLQLQAGKYSEEELSQIHQELYDDLERKAQLRKDSEKALQGNPDFKKLYDYVKALIPAQPATDN